MNRKGAMIVITNRIGLSDGERAFRKIGGQHTSRY